ncbi:hypothetical protein BDV39DRAFT_210912 [Aspergillus sergii]|uniref:Uncharacterized protein n=1 Tax=Aspergillus sergii TaxID=1034303 RepID=A0A5N6WN91_9EURO|nr:hypothetical protein BDV39DRAFT_210912 [Aspergillus sergii]
MQWDLQMFAAISAPARQPQSVENAELQTSSQKIYQFSDSQKEEELVEQPRGRIHNLQENQASSGASGKAASDSRETSHIAKTAPETNSGFHLEGRTASGPGSLTIIIVMVEVSGEYLHLPPVDLQFFNPEEHISTTFFRLLTTSQLSQGSRVNKILISEDGDTVWVTFAKPSSTYSQYLSTDTPVKDAFLDIITYGPYHLDLKEEIEELCMVIHHDLTPILKELRKVEAKHMASIASPPKIRLKHNPMSSLSLTT